LDFLLLFSFWQLKNRKKNIIAESLLIIAANKSMYFQSCYSPKNQVLKVKHLMEYIFYCR
jgi:hypothetical protein